MKAKVLVQFQDLKGKKLRDVGNVFEATADRIKEINGTAHGELVAEIKEEVEKVKPKVEAKAKPKVVAKK